MKYWPAKEPDEIEDYSFDWSPMLQEGETIASSSVEASGVTVDDDSDADGVVTVWLSGGVQGTVARVTSTVTTSSVPARTFAETAVLPIGGGPISLAQAKAHLRVEDDAEDVLIAAYLAAAVSAIESRTGKNLTPKVVRHAAKGFPATGGIRLFRGPASEVIRVEYDPADGDGSTAAAVELTSYRLVEGEDAELLAAVGESFPATMEGRKAVRVDYLAGYEPGEAPEALNQAVLMLLANFYENRSAVVVGTISSALPFGVEALIAPHCPIGIG